MKSSSLLRLGTPRSGVALVVVLAVMVLILGLLVAFLNMAKTERGSASAYVSSASTRQMADNAVGIVQAQINAASTRGSEIAWASQPGMVRTYKSSGEFDTAYKLYSASALTETIVGNLSADLPPATWFSNAATWTDLNAPVTVSGQVHYPIIDADVLAYGANDLPKGFALENPPLASGASANRVPMPVRWLYVLRDGQIFAPTGSGDTATVSQASSENPIVGRIAFWTDDDTAKLNINTASAGGYWDTPRFSTIEDYKLASSQPLNGEFQRYPGHLGTTSLKAVFPALSDQDIFANMTPRYQGGGSAQGTVDTFRMTSALNNGNVADGPLYASVDELVFKPSRTVRTQGILTKEKVDTARFFLTAVNHAPETNLFNLPRVSIWPISTTPSARSSFDNAIAFASTINGQPYYYQRASSLSSTQDATIPRNTQIFNYLRDLTGRNFPGFGVDLANKFGADRDQVLTEIWDYIRSTNLYDTRLSAGQFTGPSKASGYGYVAPLQLNSGDTQGFGRSITLSELAFIFICVADPVDTQTTPPNPNGMMGSNNPATNPAVGTTALTSTQRRVQLLILPEFFSPSQGNVLLYPKNLRITISGLNTISIGGVNAFASGSGSVKTNGEVEFNPNGAHYRKAGGPLDYRAIVANRTGTFKYPFISSPITVNVSAPGNATNPGIMSFGSGTLTVTIETSADNATWTTIQELKITPPSTDIPIPNLVRTGTPNYGTSAPNTDAQHWWTFDSATRLAYTKGDTGVFSVSGNVAVERTGTPNQTGSGSLIRGAENGTSYYTDVVRSMVPASGDYRMIAASRSLPDSAFVPLGSWSATGPQNALIHTLGAGLQVAERIPGGTERKRHFVTANPIYGNTSTGAGGIGAPDFYAASTAVLNAVMTSGDFDNSTSWWPDGSFINKPDEGNVYSDGSTIPYFRNAQEETLGNGFFSPNRMIPGPGMFGSLPTHVKRYQANPGSPENFAWRTLLFRNQPTHPNAVTFNSDGLPSAAPDHLIMDLFWMPSVEPFALSEPFATAGKVNMNYQIQPFTYIKRPTAMYGVLMNEKITAVPTNANGAYKMTTSTSTPTTPTYRLNVNIPATLEQFDTRFANSSGRLFLSPSELCDLWLVPEGSTLSSMPTFWNNYRLTGDNVRERPYTTIIPRLTTKSNTYTVHFRVQTLQPGKNSPTAWNEKTGRITGEYRGSTTIERFIDSSTVVPDYAQTPTATPTLDSFYRWRVIANHQFSP